MTDEYPKGRNSCLMLKYFIQKVLSLPSPRHCVALRHASRGRTGSNRGPFPTAETGLRQKRRVPGSTPLLRTAPLITHPHAAARPARGSRGEASSPLPLPSPPPLGAPAGEGDNPATSEGPAFRPAPGPPPFPHAKSLGTRGADGGRCLGGRGCVLMCVCERACGRACGRACVRACGRVFRQSARPMPRDFRLRDSGRGRCPDMLTVTRMAVSQASTRIKRAS